MDQPRCPKCDAAMEPTAEVCPSCGERVVPQYTPEPAGDEKGLFLCYRHKKEKTRLRCGRCGRAICPDCAIIGPAGPRCPECGRNKVPVRARGVLHDVAASFKGLFAGPYRYIFAIVLVSVLLSLLRGCTDLLTRSAGQDRSTQSGASDKD